jgi:hypothetical protein
VPVLRVETVSEDPIYGESVSFTRNELMGSNATTRDCRNCVLDISVKALLPRNKVFARKSLRQIRDRWPLHFRVMRPNFQLS